MTREEAFKYFKFHIELSDKMYNTLDKSSQAMKAVLDTEPRWIPVEERLPEYGQSVLVYVNGTRVITNRTKNDYSKDKNDFIHVVIADDATHWMPLPTPPSKF